MPAVATGLTAAALVSRWRGEAEVLRHRGQDTGARLLESCAEELADVEARGATEPLSLTDASRASGYSVAHLRRLIAEGNLRNVSADGRVRVRRGDLPKKPGHHLSRAA